MQQFQEIADNIWFIPAVIDSSFPYANSLFINDRVKLLIDTGVGKSTLKQFLKTFGQPDIILYSHAHEDHILNSNLFVCRDRFIHEKDLLAATSKEELYRLYGAEEPDFKKFLDVYLQAVDYSPLNRVQTFQDGQIYDLGTFEVQAIHAPGHSAGHSIFEIKQHHMLFVSDIDLSIFGPWYGSLDGNILDFKKSIKKVKYLSPQILISSHAGIFTEKIDKNLDVALNIIIDREKKVLDFLETSKTFDEIVNASLIYTQSPSPKELYVVAERIMVQKHLDLLLHQGKIEMYNNNYLKM